MNHQKTVNNKNKLNNLIQWLKIMFKIIKFSTKLRDINNQKFNSNNLHKMTK